MKQSDIKYRAVPRETFSRAGELLEEYHYLLSDYLDQLLWWNNKINLVSRNVPRETVKEHIRHSLLLSAFPEFQSSEVLVDAGTGGGLPGIPLAITHPGKQFILNDIASKKCIVVKQIAQKLKLRNIDIEDGSIENMQRKSPFLLVSKHAFKIGDLLEMTDHLPWTGMVFYKGMDFVDEVKEVDAGLTVTAYDLSEKNRDEFYKEKALVFVERDNR